MTTRDDRIAGTVAGQAVGDALGSHCEFGPPGSVARFGRGVFGHEAGQWTDDTEQVTCVLAARSDAHKLAGELLAWFDADPLDVGGQTSVVLSRCRTPGDVLAASREYADRRAAEPKPRGWDPGSGNGALMRTSGVALPFLSDRERIARAARTCSEVTHADEWSGDACALWSLAIADAIERGEAWTAADITDGLQCLPADRQPFWRDAIKEALKSHPSRFRPNGSAVAAFKCALSSVAHSTTYEGTVKAAVAAGGDTDTVAAIAGGLAGARLGASAIPAEWRGKVYGWSPSEQISGAQLEALALEVAGVPISRLSLRNGTEGRRR
jgi:ADP-ribosyl-[dinitrogen reductase] hydrolase